MTSTVGLSSKVRRGAAWATVNVFLSRTLQFFTTVLVARLIAPEHFGALAVALAVQAVVVNASELGATAAIARGNSDPDRIAPTVYTIALVTSAFLTLLMYLSAPTLAGAMGDDGAAPVIQVMSFTVLLSGLASVPSSMIWRDFRQERRLVADLANAATTTALVVPLALAGWEAMALAWSRVGGQVAATILLLLLTPRRYRPGLDRTVLVAVLRLGLPLAGANVVVFATLNADYVVVGRNLGAVDLGLYLLAFNLASLPSNVFTQVLRTVAVPAFGRLHAVGRLGAVVPQAVSIVALMAFPTGALLTALAGPLVVGLYGDRWAGAASALAGLGVFAAGRTLTELLADLSLGVGRTGALFWVQVLWLLTLTPALALSVPVWGIAGAAFAHASVTWFVVVPAYLVVVKHPVGLSVRTILRPGVRPALASVVCAGVAWSVASVVPNPVVAVALATLVAAVVFLIICGNTIRAATRTLSAFSAEPSEQSAERSGLTRCP